MAVSVRHMDFTICLEERLFNLFCCILHTSGFIFQIVICDIKLHCIIPYALPLFILPAKLFFALINPHRANLKAASLKKILSKITPAFELSVWAAYWELSVE
jgi:hypothetical protein